MQVVKYINAPQGKRVAFVMIEFSDLGGICALFSRIETDKGSFVAPCNAFYKDYSQQNVNIPCILFQDEEKNKKLKYKVNDLVKEHIDKHGNDDFPLKAPQNDDLIPPEPKDNLDW